EEPTMLIKKCGITAELTLARCSVLHLRVEKRRFFIKNSLIVSLLGFCDHFAFSRLAVGLLRLAA
ncbi:MAG: hypothetical protein IJX38_01515, partial [Clostridia bacterium]|nr:hypothetical protein [Clostridia bacterium]